MALLLFLLLLFTATACLRGEDSDHLDGGHSLEPFQHIDSGVYQLQMESRTCTLMLWKAYGYGLVWQSTGGEPVTSEDGSVCKLTLHKNGNLVISSPTNPVIWQSSIALPTEAHCTLRVIDVLGKKGAAAVFCDYSIVPYSLGIPLWSTGFW